MRFDRMWFMACFSTPRARSRRVLLRRFFVCLGIVAAVSPAARAAIDGTPEGIRTQIERLREHGTITLRGESVYNTPELATFYEERGFSPAWTRRDAIDELLAAIATVEQDGLTPDDYHPGAIEAALKAGDTVTADLLATDALVRVLSHLRRGKVVPTSFSREWNLEPRADTTTLAELLNLSFDGPSVAHVIDQQRPAHFIYDGLVRTLAEYRSIARQGGWPTVPDGPPLKVGDSDPRVPPLRARLAATADLAAGADRASQAFDTEVEAALRTFQDRHRLTADGVLGKATLVALNVTVAARIEQLRVNLERARWVLGGLGDSFVLVNLPAFKVYLIRDRNWSGRRAPRSARPRARRRCSAPTCGTWSSTRRGPCRRPSSGKTSCLRRARIPATSRSAAWSRSTAVARLSIRHRSTGAAPRRASPTRSNRGPDATTPSGE